MLEHLVPAQPDRAQLSRQLPRDRLGEDDDERLLDATLLGGLSGEDLPALGRPAREDVGLGGLRLDRDQRAQERVRLEMEKPRLVDETARLDQTTGALLAFLVADARFLLGEARLL